MEKMALSKPSFFNFSFCFSTGIFLRGKLLAPSILICYQRMIVIAHLNLAENARNIHRQSTQKLVVSDTK